MAIASLPPIHTDALFEQLRAGGLLLTVNNRLAKRFTSDYSQWQLGQGHTVWESPQILPLSAWLQQQVEYLSDQGLQHDQVLNPVQEKQLWIDLIQEDAYNSYMMQPTAIARQVIQAWQLLKQWQIPFSALTASETPETDALLKWSKKFEQRCQQNNWLSQTLVISRVSEAIAQQQCQLAEIIVFAGFEDPNKLHQQLIDCLVSQNCQLSQYQHQSINQTIRRTSGTDFSEELQAAANWAKQLLLQSTDKKICIVVPSLNENRQSVYHCFERTLHPERIAAPPYQHKNLFNLSLGLPLSQYPLVHDALAVLRLLQPTFSLAEISRILNATYLFKQQNSHVLMAKIDLLLRDFGRQQWSLKALISFFRKKQPDISYLSDLQWIKQLEKIQELRDNSHSGQSPENWAKLFLATWKVVGWPGSRTLDSAEYQQSERLLRLVSEFRQVQQVKTELSLSEAGSILLQMANELVFQVQSDDAPVQVSGLLEAADQQFDYLWLTGLDDQTLPARSSPNPFIPIAVQQKYGIPHCSTEREQLFASNMLRLFIQNAREVVLSHAQREQDRELRPTPLLSSLIKDGYQIEAGKISDNETDNSEKPELEIYSDRQMPPIPVGKNVRGGAAILTQQAQCPFMANASFRLGATEPQAEYDGVSPLERGNQLHLAMEKIWQQLRTQQQLLALTEEQLQLLIQQVVEDVLTVQRYKRPDLYQEHFHQLEKQRLHKLINDWMVLEKQRPASFSVIEMEQDKTIEIGGLVIKTKADRVDLLDSGERIILDYKTGKMANSRSWVEDNIREPQLPLYSLFEQHQLAALALAKINEKQSQFNGLSQHDKLLPGIKAFKLPEHFQATSDQENDPWKLLRQHWQKQLTSLAESFRQGEARINPADCNFCPYPALCRKHELANLPVEEDIA